jgi:hypothetical protein
VLFLSSACALPVATAGNFLPAGDLQPGDLHASVSMEAARVLAGPSDVDPVTPSSTSSHPVPIQAQQWQVSTWFASDVTLRWQAGRRVTLEGQLKLTNPISPFLPEVVGGSLAVRVRLVEHPPEGGVALEIGLRAVGISAEQQLDQANGDVSQTDIWDYRALGLEAPLVLTYRINSLMAMTASPFLRAYLIRAWHTEITPGSRQQTALLWTPVLSGGLAGAFAFDLGPFELAPGLAIELATRPGAGAPTHVLFEPGVSVGLRL